MTRQEAELRFIERNNLYDEEQLEITTVNNEPTPQMRSNEILKVKSEARYVGNLALVLTAERVNPAEGQSALVRIEQLLDGTFVVEDLQ